MQTSLNRASLSFFFGVSLLACGTVSAQINFISVANGDVAGLKNAINTANGNGRDDIIILATNGNYVLPAADNSTNGPTGLPVIGADSNHVVNINGNGSIIQRSGSSPFRILQVGPNAHVSIDSLIISNGSVTASFGHGFTLGAGIYSNGGTLTLTNCSVSSNTVKGAKGDDGVVDDTIGRIGDNGSGGGLASTGNGLVTLTGCTFTNNTAVGGDGGNGYTGGGIGGKGGSGNGGAISLGGGTSVINGCTFTSNAVSNGNPGHGTGGMADNIPGFAEGGAIESEGSNSVTVTHCTFSSNSAFGSTQGTTLYPGQGGAFYAFNGLARNIVECYLTNNHADFGGAVAGTTFVSGCLFESNGANSGGGAVSARGGFFNTDVNYLTNCTFYTNIAPYGGAIYSDAGGHNTAVNCTLSGNTATNTGGSAYGNLATANTIFKGGSPNNFDPNNNIGGVGIASNGHNMSDDAAGGPGGTAPGGLLNATGDKRNTNPGFVTSAPVDNGGPTRTLAIGIFGSSPAINAGDDGYAPRRDQRGYFRTGQSDIGAYEYFGGLVGASSIARSGNNVIVSAEVVYGHSYQLERKLNLSDASWTQIGNEFLATGNDIEPAPPASDLSLGRAFYHVRFTN